MKFRHLAKQKSVTSRTIVFKNSEPKIQLQKFIMILVTVAAIYWSWTWVERILRLVPNEEKIDDTQLSADDKGDRKRKLLIARSSSWALEMSRGNTMMLLYVMIKNEISQVKETNVHIPKGDSIPFLSVCPLSSIALRTLFENRPKSPIQYCERSELCLHFEWTKVHWKCQK